MVEEETRLQFISRDLQLGFRGLDTCRDIVARASITVSRAKKQTPGAGVPSSTWTSPFSPRRLSLTSLSSPEQRSPALGLTTNSPAPSPRAGQVPLAGKPSWRTRTSHGDDHGSKHPASPHTFRRHWDKQSIEQGSHSPIDLKLSLPQTFPERPSLQTDPLWYPRKTKADTVPFIYLYHSAKQPSHRQGPRAGMTQQLLKQESMKRTRGGKRQSLDKGIS